MHPGPTTSLSAVAPVTLHLGKDDGRFMSFKVEDQFFLRYGTSHATAQDTFLREIGATGRSWRAISVIAVGSILRDGEADNLRLFIDHTAPGYEVKALDSIVTLLQAQGVFTRAYKSSHQVIALGNATRQA